MELDTLRHTHLCGLFAKDTNYFTENFGEKCWEIKLQNLNIQSQRGFISATFYNEKTSDRSLYLQLSYY